MPQAQNENNIGAATKQNDDVTNICVNKESDLMGG